MDEPFRILLINPHGWQNESINLGLCYLAGAVKAAGCACTILDLTRYPMSDESLCRRAQEFRPHLVGLSGKTATANEAARVAELLKPVLGDATFLVGGPHATLCAEAYLAEHPALDLAILGEAEEAIVHLVNALRSGSSFDGLPAVAFRRDGQVIVNTWQPPEDLDQLPLPDLDAIEGFQWEGFRYPIVTSRGCPFECIYCCVNKLTGSRRWRSRSPKNVVDELQHAADKGVAEFEVWDDNLTLDLNRAKAICRELIDRDRVMPWYCHNGIRADRIDKELAGLMAAAGCTSVAFGIESGNPETFDSIKKGEPLSAVVRAVGLVKAAGIKPVGYFIIGLPGDTLDRFVETVRFQRSLGLWHHVFGMLIPYPQTEVWDLVEQQGRLLCDITRTQHFSDEVVTPSFELPGFPRQDMIRAYYIARYFELFEAVQSARAPGAKPRVAVLTTPAILPILAGMLLACGKDVEVAVLGTEFAEEVRRAAAFNALPPEVSVTFVDGPDVWKSLRGRPSVVVGEVWMLKRHLLFRNADIVACLPGDTVQPTRHVKTRMRFGGPAAGILGFLRALPALAWALRQKLLPPRVSLKDRVKTVLKPWRDRVVKLLSIAAFVRTRRKISRLRPTKSHFPYEDHSSYL